MGEMKKKKRARGRHACLPRARFFFHFAHLFPSACYAGYQLVVVASTLMQNNHECVIAWSVQAITNLVTNSWIFGTFKVGQVYWFVILDSNPSKGIWPNKSEDTIVQINPVPVNTVGTRPVPVRYTKSKKFTICYLVRL